MSPGPDVGHGPGLKNVSSLPHTITLIQTLSEITAATLAARGASGTALSAVARPQEVL